MRRPPEIDELPALLATLPNGMRVAAMHSPASRVDYFGINVNAGSRDDPADAHGMAHMVEHTIFKGTDRHRSSYIINRMEAVGGELNAYTTKEETVIYSIAPAGNLRRSAALIGELITRSTFPSAEIEREREVVLDEISSYLDTPAEAVFDEYEELAFATPPMAHNILGTCGSVKGITPLMLQRFLKDVYVPGRMVAFYFGPTKPQTVIREVAGQFGALDHPDSARARQRPDYTSPFSILRQSGHHQAHTLMGAPVCDALSPERHAVTLLANILGGPGMNSLLNVELREKRGLVYSVDASTTLMSDCGLLQIYFGSDAEDADKCVSHVDRVIRRLADGLMTTRRLDRAKQQYIGQLAVSTESAEGRALALGRGVQLYGTLPSIKATVEGIMSVTPEALARVAASSGFPASLWLDTGGFSDG